MCTWRRIFNNLLLGILMLMYMGSYAQEERLIRAQQLYRSKNIEQAMQAIDSVVTDSATRGDFISWSTRAYIYYEAYKKSDRFRLDSPLRDSIYSSALHSQSLNPDSIFRDNNRKIFMNIAASYYNISKSLLQDSIDFDRSLVAYNRYKNVYDKVEPGFDFRQKDIEYFLAVGSVFSDIFIKDNNNTKAQENAKVALMKVLELQEDNTNANINMGLMYYNQAVTLTKTMDYGADFQTIDLVQENIVKLAKQSEQFIYKVYKADNKNAKALEALYFIYYMLNEKEKSNEFKAKCKEQGINVEPTTTEK